MDRSGLWFALAYDGDIYCLSDCGDFEAAEESAASLGIEPVWIADQEQAERWLKRLEILYERIEPSHDVTGGAYFTK